MFRTLSYTLLQGLLVAAAVTLPPGCAQQYLGQAPGASPDAGGVAAGADAMAVQDADSSDPAAGNPQPVIRAFADPASSGCPSMIENPPRGLSCLHCTFPSAHQQADEIVSILTGACIRNVAVGYLVDGTFGFDADLLRSHIAQLSSGGRTLFLHLYLLNGPGQRRYKSIRFDGVGTSISPAEFRERIKSDDSLRKEVAGVVERLVPILREAEKRGAVISIVPMLEDNLDIGSFTALSDLVADSIPADVHFAMGRNPCRGCSRGADSEIPDGLFAESHSPLSSNIPKGGMLSNDGRNYCLAEQCSTEKDAIPLEQLKDAADKAAARDTIFLLWTGAWQGVQPLGDDAAGAKTVYRRPEERQYPLPSPIERAALIKFLRGE